MTYGNPRKIRRVRPSGGRLAMAARKVESALPARLARVMARRQWSLDQPLVVAVSGGADSTALLRALAAIRPRPSLVVAHLNHGVRGADADADAAFVAALAASLGLPFAGGHWRPERTAHFESDARSARYAFLASVAQRHAAPRVAVGHTIDDQAETILHRIVRGTGPRGLTGIPLERELTAGSTPTRLIRPWLAAGVSRAEVLAFLQTLAQPYQTDHTNDDLAGSTRSRIRHELLPLLRQRYNPRAAAAVVRLGELARRQAEALAEPLDRAEAAVVTAAADGPSVELNRDALAALPEALGVELLRRLWARRGWREQAMSSTRWQRLAALVREAPAGRWMIGQGVELVVDPARAVLRPAKPPGPDRNEPQPVVETRLDVPGRAAWGLKTIVASREPLDPGAAWAAREQIDLDALEPPLGIRGPRPGDRFAPLGMGGHTQAVADLLRARGVRAEARRQTPVLADRQGIVWVVGHRLAERVRITPQTRRVLHLALEHDPTKPPTPPDDPPAIS